MNIEGNNAHQAQYVVFEVDERSATKGTFKMMSTFLVSSDFPKYEEFVQNMQRLQQFFQKTGVSVTVKTGNDLMLLTEKDLITFEQFKNLYLIESKL